MDLFLLKGVDTIVSENTLIRLIQFFEVRVSIVSRELKEHTQCTDLTIQGRYNNELFLQTGSTY